MEIKTLNLIVIFFIITTFVLTDQKNFKEKFYSSKVKGLKGDKGKKGNCSKLDRTNINNNIGLIEDYIFNIN